MLLPSLIFVLASIAIASRKIPCHWVTLLGGGLLIGLAVLTPGEALTDLNLVSLGVLAGALVLTSILVQAGFFSWLAVAVANKAKDYLPGVAVALVALAAVLSSYTDGILVILLLSAFTLQFCHLLKINPLPLALAEACAVSAPTAPFISIGMALFLLAVFVALNRKALGASHVLFGSDVKAAIDDHHRSLASVRLTRTGLAAVLAAIALLVLYRPLAAWSGLPINAALAVLIPAGLALAAVEGEQRRKILLRTDGESLLFFAGLFLIVGGLAKAGVLEMLAGLLPVAGLGTAGLQAALSFGPGLAAGLVVWSLASGVDMGGGKLPIGAPLRWPARRRLDRLASFFRPLSNLFRLNARNTG